MTQLQAVEPSKITRIEIREYCAQCSPQLVYLPRIRDVKHAACRHFKLEPWQIDSHRKHPSWVYARQIVMYLCRSLTGRSYPEIGRYLGDKDHTTIIYGARKIEQLSRTDWTVAYDVARVEELI